MGPSMQCLRREMHDAWNSRPLQVQRTLDARHGALGFWEELQLSVTKSHLPVVDVGWLHSTLHVYLIVSMYL